MNNTITTARPHGFVAGDVLKFVVKVPTANELDLRRIRAFNEAMEAPPKEFALWYRVAIRKYQEPRTFDEMGRRYYVTAIDSATSITIGVSPSQARGLFAWLWRFFRRTL